MSAESLVIADLLDRSAAVEAADGDPAARVAWEKVPAKMAVYLLAGANDEPLLLATVGNLRAALQRRLADTPAEQKSKRIEYGRICRKVWYRVVYSPFAANWYYWQAARRLFPGSYRAMVSWRPTHFVTVDPAAMFPRFRRTEELDEAGAVYLGPIAERRAAEGVVGALEDLFDLCRYYHILVQAPHGKACAYKEMGKCPAPCDGSISLERYRGQVDTALAYLTAPAEAVNPRVGYTRWRVAVEDQMRGAASRLEFETAGRLKARLARGAVVEQPAFSHMDRLERFAYLALEPGPGRPWIEPFFIHGGTITPGEPVKRKDLTKACEAWYLRCRELASRPVRAPVEAAATEQMALVAHHLFRGEEDAGIYLPMHYLADAKAIEQAAMELLHRRRPVKPMAEQSSDRGESAAEGAAAPADSVGKIAEVTGNIEAGAAAPGGDAR